jgi:outer membrane protein OmpA-like peptidoglycan-associated protein/tetratricopeptide (TPR) repeat protein
MNKISLVLLFLVIFITNAVSQSYTVDSKRAIHMYEAATQAYGYTQYDKCLELLDEAINREEEFVEAWLLKAQVMGLLGRHDAEARAYKRAISIDKEFYKYTLNFSAKAHFRAGEYQTALAHAKMFLTLDSLESKDKTDGKHAVRTIAFAIESMKNPVEIDAVPIDNIINSVGDVYWPSMTVDNQLFYFTCKRPLYVNSFQEDIYESKIEDGQFTEPRLISDKVLTFGNEGASFISPDGRFMLFTACGRKDGFGSCDLYISMRRDGQWDEARNLGAAVKSNLWDSRPFISSDVKMLLFTSNRKGGKGRADIYMSLKNGEDDEGYPIWTKPQNLGDSVNTRGDEFAPFIHADNQTLYFSSDYHPGMGGQDLFMVKKLGKNIWSEPLNLGYPINKHTDEMGIFIDAPGEYAYFSTDNMQDKRSIYRFAVPDAVKPQYVSHLKVSVKDKETYRPLTAVVSLFDVETGDSILDINVQRKMGDALVSLPANKKYGLMIEKPGYIFYSDHFDLKEPTEDMVTELEILLQPIKVGQSVVLRNVFFKFDSYELSEDSKSELNRVKRFLEQNKGLTVEVAGHTDNKGDKNYNQQLSANRARAVYSFFVEQGINAERLRYKGYGQEQPKADNNSAAGRAQNRRTEMVIVEVN